MKNVFNLNLRKTEFLTKCKPAIHKLFAETANYFAVFYGSFAYNTARETSDLDLLVVSDRIDDHKINELKKLIFDLHEEYNMPLDFDIPYETKLLQPLEFMKASCSGEGIYINHQWVIPSFEKKPEILTSFFFLKRFFIAMMANPHIFILGNYTLYLQLREIATRNLLRAIIEIENLDKVSIEDMVKYLCGDKQKTGEMFLGFPHSDASYAYLTEYIGIILSTMGMQSTCEGHTIFYNIEDSFSLKPEIIR